MQPSKKPESPYNAQMGNSFACILRFGTVLTSTSLRKPSMVPQFPTAKMRSISTWPKPCWISSSNWFWALRSQCSLSSSWGMWRRSSCRSPQWSILTNLSIWPPTNLQHIARGYRYNTTPTQASRWLKWSRTDLIFIFLALISCFDSFSVSVGSFV